MPDSPKAEGPWSEGSWDCWTIYVCPNCGKPYEEAGWCEGDCGRLECEPTVVVSLSEAQAALARAEQERDEARRKLVAACVAADGATARANAAESQLAAVREWLAINEKSEQPNGPPLKESDLEWVHGFNFCRAGVLAVLDSPPPEEER